MNKKKRGELVMHIVVCLKKVLDPEITPRYFKIDPETNRPVNEDSDMVLDSFAENALELAIQLRDKTPGATVTALCLGDESSEDVLRRALAFTADSAVRVWDEEWEDLDGQAVGHILAQTIKTIGGAQIVLTGYQASDIEEGLVGPVLAEELSIPCVTLVSDLEVDGDSVKATREAEGGYSVVRVPIPAVFTVISSETNVPRLPKIKDIRLARSKSIKKLETEEMNLDTERCQPGVKLERAYILNKDIKCEILPGKDGAELADGLAGKLLALKIL
ncbi:electron transfer flavoprotein subunit beta/FixA family protein [Bacillus sp. EB600]|uniref:electron transfer flavoprotein subunit beta/FixA family protein n=1 Tax=Bacillus sp. EB600 TaxID=2806345 RepID=UPI00210951CD|nr:electron transfer flavoprotein subunit beta/FixA family protein [Bacillus sp. EB600]MCQ6279081.1 electron transfer flavoprotein subunit beta/FixA family protein [Bacillus sp. EB600]